MSATVVIYGGEPLKLPVSSKGKLIFEVNQEADMFSTLEPATVSLLGTELYHYTQSFYEYSMTNIKHLLFRLQLKENLVRFNLGKKGTIQSISLDSPDRRSLLEHWIDAEVSSYLRNQNK